VPNLSLVEVSKRFARRKALDSISFEVQDGEYLCVLGPTGSGKTTLLRIIAGLIRPDEGSVLYGGSDITRVPPEARNSVYVPQSYALFPHMTVLGNVMFGPLSHGVESEAARGVAMRFLGLVRLGHRADSYPNELSGGMQQRVALARGLASGAKLLLLDEPLGALDARLRIELRTELRDLAKANGLTVVHVTHDQEEAMTIADRIMVLHRGHMEQLGKPFHVYKRPDSIFSANFIGSTNFIEGTVAERRVVGCLVRLREDAQIIVADASHDVEEAVVVGVREEDVMISAEPVAIENTLRGEVRAKHFLGQTVKFEVLLDNGDEMYSSVRATESGAAIAVGDRVSITFEPGATHVYNYPTLGLLRELEAI